MLEAILGVLIFLLIVVLAIVFGFLCTHLCNYLDNKIRFNRVHIELVPTAPPAEELSDAEEQIEL